MGIGSRHARNILTNLCALVKGLLEEKASRRVTNDRSGWVDQEFWSTDRN
jgi:hypothetical protein